MKDEYVTREEFEDKIEEMNIRFNTLKAKADKTAKELNEIYPDIRDWMDQQAQIISSDVKKQIADTLKKGKKRSSKIIKKK